MAPKTERPLCFFVGGVEGGKYTGMGFGGGETEAPGLGGGEGGMLGLGESSGDNGKIPSSF